MDQESAAKTVTDCPEWCGVNHRAGATFHAHCVGEVRWRRGSVEVVITRSGGADGVEMGYHAAGEPPAIAFIKYADLRRLRDCLDEALGALDAA